MPRTTQDAIKWAIGTLRQYRRLCESYDKWHTHHSLAARDESSWTLEARQLSDALQGEYLVDAHLFLVTSSQLVKTLTELGRAGLLALIPHEHVTHARNSMEHDDDRGLYQRDYQGYGWTIGPGSRRNWSVRRVRPST